MLPPIRASIAVISRNVLRRVYGRLRQFLVAAAQDGIELIVLGSSRANHKAQSKHEHYAETIFKLDVEVSSRIRDDSHGVCHGIRTGRENQLRAGS